MKRVYIVLLMVSLSFLTYAQSAHKSLRDGDMLYHNGKYPEAETAYRRADAAKSSLKSTYNLGNTLMQQERYDEAIKKYEDAATKASNNKERAAVYHNLGNAQYKKKQYHESIDAYKNALRYQPADNGTKENLAIARRELKKQQQDKKNNKDKQNKDQDKDQQEQNKDQQNKDKQNNKDQQNKDQKQQNDQNQEKGKDNQPSDKKMSKQDAEKLLEIMDNEEKKVQQKMRRVDGKSKRLKKDW